MAPLPRPCPTEVAARLLEDDAGRALLVRACGGTLNPKPQPRVEAP